MSNDGNLKAAIAAFIASLALVGGALGLFLVFVAAPGKDERVSEGPGDRRSLPELLGLRTPPEPAKCADPDACLEPAVAFLDRYGDPTSCDWYELHICIVPLGDVPRDLVDHLVRAADQRVATGNAACRDGL